MYPIRAMHDASRLQEIVICADASPGIGTGHVMRCLALAQASHDQGMPVRMIGRVTVPWVLETLAYAGIPFVAVSGDIPVTETPEYLLAQFGNGGDKCWMVLDGYHFGLDCQQTVRAAGYKLLIIDDCAYLPEYSCDILLNQNIDAENLVYKGDIGRKLLGPQYALLRPEFLATRSHMAERRFPEKAKNILLTLGGGDFSEHLAHIAPGFSMPELTGYTLRIIAGAMPQKRIRGLLRDCPAEVQILDRVDDMPALLLDTDLCVTAGGSTCWELCCIGVPFLTLEVAENQHNIAYGLQKRGIAKLYAPACFAVLMSSSAARRKSTKAGLALVDGMGVGRVIRALTG